jgi:S-adenosylmethionine hydrolase
MVQPVVALLTDFGMQDPYVGVMKGVIATHCPDAHVIDISHEVEPQNIRQGAYRLWTAYRYFPIWTVFVAVVDPGVGTDRRAIALQTSHGVFVGPDNGLFSAVLLSPILRGTTLSRAVKLTPSVALSRTFHGRDLFAPVGAAIASGKPVTDLGIPIDQALDDITRLDILKAEIVEPGRLHGEIVDIDRYGNLITSLGPCEASGGDQDFSLGLLASRHGSERVHACTIDPMKARLRIRTAELAGIQATYGNTEPGNLLALVNSAGMIEIAANQADAAGHLGAAIGDLVEVTF